MSRLLSWAARFLVPGSVARIQEQDGSEGKAAAAPADAYPLDATGWGTCGWPL
ncbi:hypothetical protein [Janthinobacterium sp. ROICE36]|uniref:hypothetical protein n=1 Tax=Janthinobacterium sp. ROICE36 TaxID=2048670 RepID=UPI0015E0F2FF|nr:hypothetical protein [Janthinobacterium sp. ROICE36]